MVRRRVLAVLAIVAAFTGSTTTAAQSPTRLLGVYDASTKDPVEAAELTDLLGQLTVHTPASGTLPLAFLRRQRDSGVVRIRKVGYRDTSFIVALGPRDTSGVMIFLQPLGQLLDTMRVVERFRLDTDDGARSGFANRCAVDHVSCWRPAELEAHASWSVSDLLVHASDGGVTRSCAGSMSRCTISIAGCHPHYFLNGYPVPDDFGLAGIEKGYGARELEGIEIYRKELMPIRYAVDPSPTRQCAVVVWTKP